jgi:hypothetical protein
MLADGVIGVDDRAIICDNCYSFCERVKDLKPMLERFLVRVFAEEVLLLKQLYLVRDGRIDEDLKDASEHEQRY